MLAFEAKKVSVLCFTRKAVATVQSTKTMKKMPRTESVILRRGRNAKLFLWANPEDKQPKIR